MKRSWRGPVETAITAFSGLVAIASVLFVATRPAVAAMIARHWQEPWAAIVVDVFGAIIGIAIFRTLNAALAWIVRALW